MNVKLLHEKLIRAARSTPPSDRVPYAFEQRIMAQIRAERVLDSVTLWTRALWRASVPCVCVMLFLSLWATNSPEPTPTTTVQMDDLGTELETTLMASVSFDSDYAW